MVISSFQQITYFYFSNGRNMLNKLCYAKPTEYLSKTLASKMKIHRKLERTASSFLFPCEPFWKAGHCRWVILLFLSQKRTL